MKESKIAKLYEKYKEGDTSLNEERFIFDNAKDSEPALEVWSTFVKNNEVIAPQNFNDELWESFHNKRNKKRKIAGFIMSAAASALLLITLFVGNSRQGELSYSEKEALLNQALNMFPNTTHEVIERNIIYENEMIIVYTTNE